MNDSHWQVIGRGGVISFVAMAVCFGVLPAVAVDDSLPVSRMGERTQNRSREPGLYGDHWWANRFLSRHRQIERLPGGKVDVVMLGDSIMHFWEWLMPESWATFAAGRSVLNLGYGGDTTRQVIWRIEHGELDGYEAKNVLIMIGTNNNAARNADPDSVARAVEKIVGMVREHQPHAKIILNAIFPRGDSAESEIHARARRNNDVTNSLLKKFAEEDGRIVYLDINFKYLDKTGWVPKTLMYDGVHPTAEGYAIWVDALNRILGGREKRDACNPVARIIGFEACRDVAAAGETVEFRVKLRLEATKLPSADVRGEFVFEGNVWPFAVEAAINDVSATVKVPVGRIAKGTHPVRFTLKGSGGCVLGMAEMNFTRVEGCLSATERQKLISGASPPPMDAVLSKKKRKGIEK